MPKFTFRQLEYFVAVAAHGSISAASDELFVSRSTLANALNGLEQALGTTLFVRTKAQGMALTPSGKEILDQAHQLLRGADELENKLQGPTLRGTLSVGCFPSLSPTLLPRLLAYFGEKYPEVTLRTFSEPVDRLVELLLNGEIELAVSYSLHNVADLSSEKLYDAQLHCILAADHPLASSNKVAATALQEEDLIMLDSPPSPSFVADYFASVGITPRIHYRFNNFEVIRSLVARGTGYSLVMQRPNQDVSYEGLPLAARALDPAPSKREVSCAWLTGRGLSRLAQAGIEGIRHAAPPIHSPSLYADE